MLKILIILALIPFALYGLYIVLPILGGILATFIGSIFMIFKGDDYKERGIGCLLLIIIVIIVGVIAAIIS